jgi:catechol 2,3-dioxygenase-like lactoylglutathione lyase family enzyme
MPDQRLISEADMNYQLEHIAIYTKDIAESIQFYETFFAGHANRSLTRHRRLEVDHRFHH